MDQRSYHCDGCGGTVSVPDYSRTITLDQVRKVHEDDCPGRAFLAQQRKQRKATSKTKAAA